MKLQFKFKERVSPEAREKLTDRLSAKGAKHIRQLFPDAEDEELASIYILNIETAKKSAQLKKILGTSKDIEFVEEEVRRKLV